MDDFPIGSTPRYDPYHNEQRRADSKRKKVPRHKIGVPAVDVHVSQPAESDAETAANLGVQDYYTPTPRTDKSE